MNLPFIIAQLILSLVLVAMVAALAVKLGLGRDVRLRDEAEAKALGKAALCGFHPVDLAMDKAGIGALLRDETGRVMLLRRHGAQFVARLLDSHVNAQLDRNFLTIGIGERRFGRITLDLGPKAQIWAASLRRLGN